MNTTTEHLTALINTLTFAQRATADEWVRESGLSRQQAFTLGYIEEHQDRGVIARELAEIRGTTPASVASLLQGMEDRGLITRTPSPDDSRVKHVRVTAEGSRLVAGFDDDMIAAQQRLFGALTDDERDQLRTLLEKIVDAAGLELFQPPQRGDVRPAPPGSPRT